LTDKDANPVELATLDRQGRVAIVTLNRPEKANALNDPLGARVHELLDEIDAAWPEVRVVVLTANGRAFCAGGDMAQMAARRAQGLRNAPYGREVIDLAPHLRRIPQPVIAAVNGPAMGAGLALACACDIRLAAASARFAAPFIRNGLAPDTGLSQSLQRIIGAGRASEMMLTGHAYDPDWAERAGLINTTVPDEALLTDALELATAMAEGAPRALRATKRVADAFAPNLSHAIAVEREFNRRYGDDENR
jgi:enoyl-CoA hydratase/carnithine racemase